MDTNDRSSNSDDLIDELDDAALNTNGNSNIDEFLLGESEEGDEEENVGSGENNKGSSLYYYDHQSGAVRRGFNKKSIDEWEDYISFERKLGLDFGFSHEGSNAAFSSDDVPVDEKIREKVTEIQGIEDALLLKGSKLREGWGEWFDKKGDFLRRDKMFKSNLDVLNPLHNPILQDPDGPGVTGLTRGDKLVQKGLLNEFKKVTFPLKKALTTGELRILPKSDNVNVGGRETMRIKRKTLDNNSSTSSNSSSTSSDNGKKNNATADSDVHVRLEVNEIEDPNGIQSSSKRRNYGTKEVKNAQNELSGLIYANGKRWGYYPGLDSRLSFSNFMDAFFRKGKCNKRFFMVWNSAPWMFGVRYQRGLESVLFHNRDACVVIFSEALELNFFNNFVKEGFKVAVVMPNLDELLEDTKAHVFASVWHDWKKTKYYPIHYSELIRLAALYKYGGVYLDSDIIMLKPLHSLNSIVGLEDELNKDSLNGAVMAFRKHSPFVKECLTEFYLSYDDTLLRWNGADLLSRVAQNVSSNKDLLDRKMELNLQPYFVFFPISHNNISRYFAAPGTESERAEQELLLNRILKESVTVHLWNSVTSALIPEPESLIARLINHFCIHCSDEL